LLVATALRALVVAPSPTALDTDLTGRITDHVSVFDTTQRADIQATFDQVERQSGVRVWVLFVTSMHGAYAPDYAKTIAAANELSPRDALLVVGLGDRSDSLWVGDGLPQITTIELGTIILETLRPGLEAGTYAATVEATARALGAAATSDVAPTVVPPYRPVTTLVAPVPQQGPGGVPWQYIVFGVLVLGVSVSGWLRQRHGSTSVPDGSVGRPQIDVQIDLGAAHRNQLAATEAMRLNEEMSRQAKYDAMPQPGIPSPAPIETGDDPSSPGGGRSAGGTW
jgi:uncharacterized membrane protein YgcG